MEEYDINEYNSEEDINPKLHARFIDEIHNLDKKQYVKKPSRTEPAIQVSEFNLVKPSTGRTSAISIKDLTKSLNNKKKHIAISKKIKFAQTKANTLLKPLNKPQADRIRRSIGFDKVSSELGKWNAIVERNRVASQLVFPLNKDKIDIVDNKDTKDDYEPRYKSELDIELEKLEPVVPQKEEENKFPLSMAELVQRRQEIAKLRAIQTYQELKAHKQNKIKSKSYHRIQRKEKLKLKIKEFELLQKTNPEEALRKLEELEKVRAEERMSLRHRSTGHWARNKKIQAKYNKESRQALAQQLTLSRDLTQKMKANDSSESETEEPVPENPTDISNPWIVNRSNEVNEFVSGYRKFWNEQNKKKLEENQEHDNTNNKNNKSVKNNENNFQDEGNSNENVDEIGKNDTKKQKRARNTETMKLNNLKSGKLKKTKKAKVLKSVKYCNSNWDVEDLFEQLEHKTKLKLQEKLNKLKADIDRKEVPKRMRKELKVEEYKEDLSMRREKWRPEIDEEIGIFEDKNKEKEALILTAANVNSSTSNSSINKDNKEVNPNKYASVKTVDLATELPTICLWDENYENEEVENDQRAFISEAFEDDDIGADFIKEKQDIMEKEKPNDIDLSLPGWGSWGGKDIQMSKRKRKRFIIKVPKELPRKDENKGNLIINEADNQKLRNHLVSELPFPFKSVKDFEASIRAPISDTFVPQTAFRRLIKAPVVVQKGAIIEPMDEEALLKQKFTRNAFSVNKR